MKELDPVCGEFQILRIDRANRPHLAALIPSATMPRMRDRAFLLIHLIATVAKLLLPGGVRSIIAESLLLKHQLLILNRSRTKAPKLRPFDRVMAGVCTDLMRPARLIRAAIVLRPSTLIRFHDALVKLFTPKRRRKSDPKGPGPELIAAIVEMKRRNPRFGCRRIAKQLSLYIRRLDRQGCTSYRIPARAPGSDPILGRRRSRTEAAAFQGILQSSLNGSAVPEQLSHSQSSLR